MQIVLHEGSEFLEYKLEVEWFWIGTEKTGVPQLRFCVPCGYEATGYRYTIPYGVIDRPPLAQDVPAIGLGCAVPEGEEAALCLLSDCKYGFRGDSTGLSLNLLRSSYEPDPHPELGSHTVRIAVGACDPSPEVLARLAERYIHPVIIRSCPGKPVETLAKNSLLHLDGAVLSSVKPAEDGNGFIVRGYNPADEQKEVKLSFARKRMIVWKCDFLENNVELLAEDQTEAVSYSLHSGGVCTFRVEILGA